MSVVIKAFCNPDNNACIKVCVILSDQPVCVIFLRGDLRQSEKVMRRQPPAEAQETHHKHDTAVFHRTYLKLILGYEQQFLLI